MAFQLSPGVLTQEQDATNVVPSVATTIGGFAGNLAWGPAREIVTIDSENNLVARFGKPNTTTAVDFLTASSYLAYGSALKVVREVGAAARNAVSASTAVLIRNDNEYENSYINGEGAVGPWAAKYPGTLGNSLLVSMADLESSTATSILSYTITDGGSGYTVAPTVTVAAPNTGTFTATGTAVLTGDTVTSITVELAGAGYVTAPDVTVASGGADTVITLDAALKADITLAADEVVTQGGTGATAKFKTLSADRTQLSLELTAGTFTVGVNTLSGATAGTLFAANGSSELAATVVASGSTAATATAVLTQEWAYRNQFDYVPATTEYAAANGSSGDEMHIIVVDEDGAITGIAGTVLEKFAGVSKASDAKDDSNQSNYYKDVINSRSKWIRWMDNTTNHAAWGSSTVGGTAFDFLKSVDTEQTISLIGGVDAVPVDGDLNSGYALFANDSLVDVNLIVAGGHSKVVGDYIIDNVTAIRKDCLVFISPLKASVVNNAGSEATAIIADITAYTRSSYAVMDSGWKYMYDKYNDKYYWVPCNADTAGCCVTADLSADPWFSPAGYNRGAIKNAVKLAYSPGQADRDSLYRSGINPIVGFPGNGIVLFGDKTMLAKDSAFNRINVRRLFITVEKAISTAAQFQLFEFNDSFTRGQFRSLVEPFLRDVQGRRGIYDFRVVCDETNNTAETIDQNEFRADIYIKPARSINFITLTFVATRTGISFEELGA
tara:strand:- start:12529 stop:14703 length:2175 start_codon:yes stop_codon:yes gene_type:complete